VIIAAVIVMAACSSDGDEPAAGDVTAVDAPTATPTGATAVPSTDGTASTTPTVETTDATATTIGDAADLELIGQGPYDVGVSTVAIGADTARPLTVDVWFPLASADGATAHQYTLIPGVYYESPNAVSATADQIATDGPFPLVVYSHGSGGLRYIASYYAEAIASHGYVVAAADHTGNTAVDRLAGTEADFAVNALNRPTDVDAVIDAFVDPARPETGAFAAAVDPESIAVTGHSFGGFTTLAMGSGYANDLGTFAADPRVDALIALAPALGSGANVLLDDAALATIETPTLLMAGTADQSTPIDPNLTRPWAAMASDELYRVELTDAGHQSFTDLCDYQAFLPTLPTEVPLAITETIDGQAADGCSATNMPIARAKELTNTFAIAFLESVFRDGDPIDPTTTAFPGDVVVLRR